jgi:hypothetical protein
MGDRSLPSGLRCAALPLSAGTPRNAPVQRRPPTCMRDRLEWGPSLPKPPPYGPKTNVFGYPISQATWGAALLKALSSHAGC